MTSKWLAVLSVAAMSLTVWSQSKLQDRFSLTADQVAQSVSKGGIEVSGDQVFLLANVVAKVPDPVLDVLSVEPLGDKWFGGRSGSHSWVRLGCHLPGECLPFYAVVSWPQEPAGHATNQSIASPAALTPKKVITMRAGTHATMLMDDGKSHIQIAVISLENGVAGHSIRVTSPDHKQVYVAEVVNASLLRKSY
jgi:hypothetical protein